MVDQTQSNPTPTASQPTRSGYGGIYKWGKWKQAKSYASQLQLAKDNAIRGMETAWSFATKASGVTGAKASTMPAEDETAYIDSPVTNYYQAAKPSALGTLAKTALIAAGIGGPIAMGLWKLPEIIAALNPPKPSVSTTVVQPKTSGDGNTKYRLRLGKPTE